MGRPSHQPNPFLRRQVEALAAYGVPEIDGYFRNRHFGTINRDLRDFLDGRKDFYPLAKLREKLPPDQREWMIETVGVRLRELAVPNYFFSVPPETGVTA